MRITRLRDLNGNLEENDKIPQRLSDVVMGTDVLMAEVLLYEVSRIEALMVARTASLVSRDCLQLEYWRPCEL
jgi:hypothetical protein